MRGHLLWRPLLIDLLFLGRKVQTLSTIRKSNDPWLQTSAAFAAGEISERWWVPQSFDLQSPPSVVRQAIDAATFMKQQPSKILRQLKDLVLHKRPVAKPH